MRGWLFLAATQLACLAGPTVAQQPIPADSILSRQNLVAWCVVPFDAKKRGPAERAEMLRRLGLLKFAYDWRKEHVSEFEEDILQCKRHGIEFFAFWNWHDSMAGLIRKHGIRPQIWKTNPSPIGSDRKSKIEMAAAALMPLARQTNELGLKLGLYNHGGWGGRPRNLVAVCKYLRDEFSSDHVGIVYNFHHGHEDVDNFARALGSMQPYLLCVNLNGMANAEQVAQFPAQKILDIGSGAHERAMIRTLLSSGYDGPIGILDHRSELDAEVSLRSNLEGLNKVWQSMEDPEPGGRAVESGQHATAREPSKKLEASTFTVHRGLTYSDVDPRLQLDLFVPKSDAPKTPCVIVIQGGGFRPQDGQRFRPFAEYLASHGLAAALIGYRGSPHHQFRDTIADTKAAVRFIRSVAADYRIDPEKIGAVGRSAGGTLAALLAVTGGEHELEGEGGHATFSSRIQAAVAFAGVFDFVARFTDKRQLRLQPNAEAKRVSNGEWIGAPFASHEPAWQTASAINHVDPNDAPVLFLHCKDDTTVPWIQSHDMFHTMEAHGIGSQLILLEQGGHNLSGQGMEDMVRFLQEKLADDTSPTHE